MAPAIAFIAPIITALSLFAGQRSYIAITNLQQYEEQSERAAKHSETASQQLWKTRVTQGSSAGAIFLSLASSLTVIGKSVSDNPFTINSILLVSSLNMTAVAAAFVHNRDFWKAKAKVPFVRAFNEGIQKSGEIRQLLVPLGFGWAILGAFAWL